MKRENFDIAAGIVQRMDILKQTIFDTQDIMKKKSFLIIASDDNSIDKISKEQILVRLNSGEIATEVFIQDVLEYYINTLNLELEELIKSFEDLA